MNTLATQARHAHDNRPLNLHPSFSQVVVRRIQQLLDEDLSFVVKRLTIHDGVTEEYANRLRVEFLRFVALRQQYSGTIVPSKAVDVFWHAFILYTEEYTSFCEKHLGVYMHHRPQDHFASTAAISIAAKRTMEHLDQMFLGYDSEVWKHSAICCDPGDCGCP